MISLISGDELASQLRFDGVSSSFRKFCKEAGIEPVPGRRDCYDPVAVRYRLNEIQGIGDKVSAGADNALQRSRLRRNG